MNAHFAQEQISSKFLEIYEAHGDALFRFCFFKLGDREQALDMVQQSFLKFWTYLQRGEAVDQPKALLYKIAGNAVIDFYRKKKAESLDTLAEEGFDPPDLKANTAERDAEAGQALKAISQLSPEDQNLITWRYLDDMPLKEIAGMLGERENTVSVRLHRAVDKLKGIMRTDE